MRDAAREEGEGRRGSAVYVSRGCPQDVFPSSFIYFSYLFIHLSAGSAIGRAGLAGAIFIYFPPTCRGFPIAALRLAARAINPTKVEMNLSPSPSSPASTHLTSPGAHMALCAELIVQVWIITDSEQLN